MSWDFAGGRCSQSTSEPRIEPRIRLATAFSAMAECLVSGIGVEREVGEKGHGLRCLAESKTSSCEPLLVKAKRLNNLSVVSTVVDMPGRRGLLNLLKVGAPRQRFGCSGGLGPPKTALIERHYRLDSKLR